MIKYNPELAAFLDTTATWRPPLMKCGELRISILYHVYTSIVYLKTIVIELHILSTRRLTSGRSERQPRLASHRGQFDFLTSLPVTIWSPAVQIPFKIIADLYPMCRYMF